MQRTDLDTPFSTGPSITVRPPCRFLRLSVPAILLVSCAILASTNCYAQDVADAAKQEKARKEAPQKKSKHVYTEEDLKRAQILTPEDRAEIAARKNQQMPPVAQKSPDAVDAQSLSPDAPLGDVARRFRQQKQTKKLQQSAEFHLPFVRPPALASPKPPIEPLLPNLSKPPVPRFAPYQPPVKHSPFVRPRVFIAAPPFVATSRPPGARLVPAQPPTPVASVGPASANAVTVKRGDSLWKLAEQYLGKGLRWHELLPANPGILDPNHIVAGSQIVLPTASASLRTSNSFTVRSGDTLSTIAETELGHASYAACIAHANPVIQDANLIYAGQVLLLPASC